MPIASTDRTANSKRIASNSLVLFIRMLVIMVINLYAVRLVLRGLGQESYGVFNAVAGVVLASSFITTTLATSFQRFLSYALGTNDRKLQETVFSASINISLALVAILLLSLELIGPWLIHTQLTIPAGRMAAAETVFQFSLVAFLLSLLQVPFTAAIFSNEDMPFFALVSFIECLGRLGVAIAIPYVLGDGLVFYGMGLMLVAILVFLTYGTIALRKYALCHYRVVREKGIYKELLGFSGWTMYGALAGVGMSQGQTILLNVFFGPLANAAFSVAIQIYNAMIALANNVNFAFRPVMIKSYASCDYNYLDKLFEAGNKFLLYAMLSIAIPAIVEMETILGWWLGDQVSESMVLFTRLFMVHSTLLSLHNPITAIIQATGKIKYYSIFVESITILCVPLSWLMFRLGFPSYYAFVSMIGTCSIAHAVRLACLKRLYPQFSYERYAIKFFIPGVVIAGCGVVVANSVRGLVSDEVLQFLLVFILTISTICLLVYFFALTKDERDVLKQMIRKVLRKRA